MMGRGICSGPKELIVVLSGLTEMGMGLVEDDGGKTGWGVELFLGYTR